MSADDPRLAEGFTGTVPELLDWLGQRLTYGGVRIETPRPDEFRPDRMVYPIKMHTGGFSDDEELLGRLAHGSMFSALFWKSTHRGGLYIYEVGEEYFDPTQRPVRTMEWLVPATDDLLEMHRARTMVVTLVGGGTETYDLPHGAAIAFEEPNRDINAPAGVLRITAFKEPFDHRGRP